MPVNPYDNVLQPEQHEGWFREQTAESVRHKPARVTRDIRGKAKAKAENVIATCDFETDPFHGPGFPIYPFAAGFYDGTTYTEFWGNDSPEKLAHHIMGLTRPHIIYAHNGGKFDFMFLLPWIEPDVFCIGSRIVKCYIKSSHDPNMRHELRDSLAIIPVPLKHAAEKMEFDYDKMLASKRERYKMEIREYLKQDCVELRDVVTTYRGVFGNTLTMASAAMAKLNEAMRPYVGRAKTAERMSEREDDYYRQWYFGGRVECFERGVVRPRSNRLEIYDINSSYPDVMRNIAHPIGTSFRVSTNLEADTDFAHVIADSDGALPVRNQQSGRLTFPHGRVEAWATGHEIRAGMELGLLRVLKVIEARTCSERVSFAPFIDTYWEARQIAKRNGEAVYDLFWKLVMNGAYGKFAQNPRKFKDTMICRLGDDAPDAEEGWTLDERHQLMDVYTRRLADTNPAGLWRSYINVATGASITGAARASLLRGLASATRPIYCDTDSILCEGLGSEVKQGSELGAWKLEATGDYAAVCEKKLYGLFGPRSDDAKVEAERVRKWRDPYCVKIASKGVRLTAAQILKVAEGEAQEWSAEAPTFRRDGSQWWLKRTVRMAG